MKRLPLSMAKSVGIEKWNDFKTEWNTQFPTLPDKPVSRVNGNEYVRRYCDGSMDVRGTAEKVLRAISYMKDGIAPVQYPEKALLVLFMPKEFGFLMDRDIAKTYARRISEDEIKAVQEEVKRNIENYKEIKDLETKD